MSTTCAHPTEDMHTAPHPVAPHPERWHAPDGDSTECEVSELVGALVRALQPDLVVETGTAYGWTTLRIAEALTANGHGRCVSLDVDDERLHAAANLLNGHDAGNVTLLRQSSLDYTPDEPIGFALFDSLYELRVDEFLRYRDLGALTPGTIVAFHDWTSGLRGHHMDIRAELERRLVAPGLLRAVYLPTPRGLAVGEVL